MQLCMQNYDKGGAVTSEVNYEANILHCKNILKNYNGERLLSCSLRNWQNYMFCLCC